MPFIADSFSSQARPVLMGHAGAVSAAHPLAAAAAQDMLMKDGSAADALIAAQAVLCVVAPDACGLGGDMFALIQSPVDDCISINAAGAAPAAMTQAATDGANSITVPGIVHGWEILFARWGRLPRALVLGPAIRLANEGFRIPDALAAAVDAQRPRLERGGAAGWDLLHLGAGSTLRQPRLAQLLRDLASEGSAAFYNGPHAEAIVAAVAAMGGALSMDDMNRHQSEVIPPVTVSFRDVSVHAQPPMTQGILLAMALAGWERVGEIPPDLRDHVGIELTEAVFAYRSSAARGKALLAQPLAIDMTRSSRRGGPRAYLHTAGVAVADARGLVISSLVSLFDDFGSCIFVPECGITLNNRAGGFTDGDNAAAPGKRPVHTLAPAMVSGPHGLLAMATPGADGQIQTLLQVLTATFDGDQDIASAIASPRWRSENGSLLIEEGHPASDMLRKLGHKLEILPPGDMRFGAVVAAGIHQDHPFAVADWRRQTWAGVV